MVNILTHSEAAASFDREMLDNSEERKEGEPGAAFNYDSALMKVELTKAESRVSHTKAPGVLGHVVKPGYISFYTLNGKTFAVSEGRWWLMKVRNMFSCLNICTDIMSLLVFNPESFTFIL